MSHGSSPSDGGEQDEEGSDTPDGTGTRYEPRDASAHGGVSGEESTPAPEPDDDDPSATSDLNDQPADEDLPEANTSLLPAIRAINVYQTSLARSLLPALQAVDLYRTSVARSLLPAIQAINLYQTSLARSLLPALQAVDLYQTSLAKSVLPTFRAVDLYRASIAKTMLPAIQAIDLYRNSVAKTVLPAFRAIDLYQASIASTLAPAIQAASLYHSSVLQQTQTILTAVAAIREAADLLAQRDGEIAIPHIPTTDRYEYTEGELVAEIELALAVEAESVTRENSLSHGPSFTLGQASAMIGTGLLIALSIALYVGNRECFEAVSDIFGLPSNIFGAIALVLYLYPRK